MKWLCLIWFSKYSLQLPNFQALAVFCPKEFPRAVPELQADAPAADQPGREQQDPDVCQRVSQGGLLQRDAQLPQVGTTGALPNPFCIRLLQSPVGMISDMASRIIRKIFS